MTDINIMGLLHLIIRFSCWKYQFTGNILLVIGRFIYKRGEIFSIELSLHLLIIFTFKYSTSMIFILKLDLGFYVLVFINLFSICSFLVITIIYAHIGTAIIS